MARRTLVAAAVLFALAGCGGNPTPSPVATPSVSASSSGAPTMPAAAKGTTPESAEAFVRYYLAVFSYAAVTGDVSLLRKLGTTTCESCNGVIRRISDTYANGGHATGNYSATNLRSHDRGGSTRVLLTLVSARQVITLPSVSPSAVPAGSVFARFDLVSRSGSWLVRDWTRT